MSNQNEKKRVLLVVDVRDWAYDDAAKNWQKRLSDKYDINIIYLSDYKPVTFGHRFGRLLKNIQSDALEEVALLKRELLDYEDPYIYSSGRIFDQSEYDGIYFFYHRALCDSRLRSTPLSMRKVCVAINNEKWVEKTAPVEFNTYMKGAKIIAGCNSNVIKSFENLGGNVMRVSQSVDEKVFYTKRKHFVSSRCKKDIKIGWSGSPENPIKNLSLVQYACKMAGVELSIASNLDRNTLNDWYNELDAVVCASESEGGPLMLLEAGAAGIPVISVPVGLSREIIKNGETGLIVDWDKKSICNAIKLISNDRALRGKLGLKLKKEVLRNWTYDARIKEIDLLFEALCNSDSTMEVK